MGNAQCGCYEGEDFGEQSSTTTADRLVEKRHQEKHMKREKRKQYLEKKEKYQKKAELKASSALQIQRVYRGRVGRSKAKALAREQSAKKVYQNQLARMTSAAVTLQRLLRAHACRQRLRREKQKQEAGDQDDQEEGWTRTERVPSFRSWTPQRPGPDQEIQEAEKADGVEKEKEREQEEQGEEEEGGRPRDVLSAPLVLRSTQSFRRPSTSLTRTMSQIFEKTVYSASSMVSTKGVTTLLSSGRKSFYKAALQYSGSEQDGKGKAPSRSASAPPKTPSAAQRKASAAPVW
eukprot:CAMPEP_0113939810 /NCGR_PEP_ID=MMETSP1339-20121228/6058_1 /TAXON_ID=94617 /ORGANISM="Fibrocapsa japonica" /LENGTH=290 /DNA_ID=CAMNT_0000943425 /DNA_START=125 /DNA_END=997 /DNA_ORIENTATION=+ /assembly_acc=CAM_ASM_000762